MATINDVLTVAKSKIGQKETGKNVGQIVKWATSPWLPNGWDISKPHPSTGKMGWAAWCAGFVSTCYLRAGFAMRGIGSLSVDALYDRCARKFVVRPPHDYIPVPGDIIFFGPKGDLQHCGIVEFSEGDTVHTIEGNTGDSVRQHYYTKTDSKIFAYATLIQSI